MSDPKPWTTSNQGKPPVFWDEEKKTFRIFLEPPGGLVVEEGGIEAEWSPELTYVIRIREKGGEWSVGFTTPLQACGFSELKPNTEYEVEIRSENAEGLLSEPATSEFRTEEPENATISQ